eukprot:CAMPEP_0116155368 /NCGR_PEP_ID=MMETSP0329-20121206/22271_1 /TAXON_ID=697910 /ORGANISM="Pseudo-nitzschia arenysensis, Strain B593" /LENGTH=495 /DNA_ID=CAMNT_0003652399 /DNA_START=30 /DNA_END=1514 /DNA_ORIENTATION=+
METPSKAESVMESLLKNANIDWNEFLTTIWEKKCHRFAFQAESTPKDLWSNTVNDGWGVLTHVLENTHPMNNLANDNIPTGATSIAPLLFQNLQPMDDPEEIEKSFGTSLYRAYLAGTSIVWNHAESVSPKIHELCQNLQDYQHFPHVYANAYLTPPHSQTVPAHADDRDVLVFQLVGKKNWNVYERIPIPHPYPHQQVGKAGIPVPEAVTTGPKAFEGCLVPGDVLYLPRGMVHEADTTQTKSGEPAADLSFHITVALATHDWTLGGNLGKMIQNQLLESTIHNDTNDIRRSLLPTWTKNDSNSTHNDTNDIRRSLLPIWTKNDSNSTNEHLIPCGGSLVDAKALQKQLDSVFESLRSQITAKSILENMNQRMELHNKRAMEQRHFRTLEISKPVPETSRIVGLEAAKLVALETTIRAATPAERECARKMLQSSNPSGLNVRDSVGDDVASIVIGIKGGATAKVKDFRTQFCPPGSALCDLTALSLAKRAVTLG